MMRFSQVLPALLAVGMIAPIAASASEWTFTTLYSFKGGIDGSHPASGVVADASGALYGTTRGEEGEQAYNEQGTVYKLTPPTSTAGWTEQVLLHFPGGDLGGSPGGVIFGPAGSLYGTAAGGSHNSGIAFRLYPPAPSNNRWHGGALVYDFANDDVPEASLLRGPGNVLYGTGTSTDPKGSHGGGSVFALVPPVIVGGAWTLDYLYIFPRTASGYPIYPRAALISDASGALYGTTETGGVPENGTVFKLTPPSVVGGNWTETVLYTFPSPIPNDVGATYPGGLVMDKTGALYGITSYGGTKNFGTIFRLTPPTSANGTWGYSVLYNCTGDDDAYPSDLILSATGEFYGTTSGGESNHGSVFYNGTIFRLTPPSIVGGAWTKRVLYSFHGFPDGSHPGALLLLHGALYGITYVGGADPGVGTVFKLAPPP